MKKEIIIGRQGEFKVDDPSVSRLHAKVTRTKDGVYVEDLGSTGGTYVNGKAVKKKKITATDSILLGNEYKLNLNKILRLLPISDEEFHSAMLQMKKIYEKYNAERNKIQSEGQMKSMLKRSIPMSLPSIILVVVNLVLGKYINITPNTSMLITVCGTAFSALIMLAGCIWGAKESGRVPERLSKLQEQFMLDYSCPSCGREFGMRSWDSLKRQGKCLACQREFDMEE